MFYYINEPIEGGGTAFPFADNVTYNSSVSILSLYSACWASSIENFKIEKTKLNICKDGSQNLGEM